MAELILTLQDLLDRAIQELNTAIYIVDNAGNRSSYDKFRVKEHIRLASGAIGIIKEYTKPAGSAEVETAKHNG